MGNCPSTFRGKFTPNEEATHQGVTTDIVLKPVEEKNEKMTCEDSDDDKTIPMIDGEEESISLSNGGSGDPLREFILNYKFFFS